MTHQLSKWLYGISEHDAELDRCVPDFSCCNGKKIAPTEQRIRFFRAVSEGDSATEMEVLGMFLGEALKGENVYVAGLSTEGGEQ